MPNKNNSDIWRVRKRLAWVNGLILTAIGTRKSSFVPDYNLCHESKTFVSKGRRFDVLKKLKMINAPKIND